MRAELGWGLRLQLGLALGAQGIKQGEGQGVQSKACMCRDTEDQLVWDAGCTGLERAKGCNRVATGCKVEACVCVCVAFWVI